MNPELKLFIILSALYFGYRRKETALRNKKQVDDETNRKVGPLEQVYFEVMADLYD